MPCMALFTPCCVASETERYLFVNIELTFLGGWYNINFIWKKMLASERHLQCEQLAECEA